MKWLVLLSLFLVGCGGSLTFTPNGHMLYYKNIGGEISCYGNNCCYPYKQKLMVCTEATLNDVSISIKFMPEK
jgi:hypothetical protein